MISITRAAGRLALRLAAAGGALAAAPLAAQAVVTFAGSGTPGFLDGPAATASLLGPGGVAVGPGGTVYVADTRNHAIRAVLADGTVTTLAGNGTPGAEDGQGTAARFRSPSGLAVDGTGAVIVADTGNHAIRLVSPSGEVTTLAGSGVRGSRDGTGPLASFAFPSAVAVDGSGNVWVADSFNNELRRVAPDGAVTTVAGSGLPASVDGTGRSASFFRPSGVAVDPGGTVYVSDLLGNRVRVVTPGGTVATLAGTGVAASLDGPVDVAAFDQPAGLAVAQDGTLYVAEREGRRLRAVSPSGTVTTLAGSGLPGRANGAPATASFDSPAAVALDALGDLLVADAGNDVIRELSPSAAPPDPHLLRLARDRFELAVAWHGYFEAPGPAVHLSTALPMNGDSGGFRFFGPSNVDLVVRVVPNQAGGFVVSWASLTDMEFDLTVTDTAPGGETLVYHNPAHRLASGTDPDGFAHPVTPSPDQPPPRPVPPASAPGPGAGPCEAGPATLCLSGGRFRVGAAWAAWNDHTGTRWYDAGALPLTSDTGLLWFSSPWDPAVAVKVLDFGGDRFLVMFGSLSGTAFDLTVEDTVTGRRQLYRSPPGTLAAVADGSTF